MRILIYGAGVIGCTYGWQLSQSGHDVTVLVREQKKQKILDNGIHIHCTDYRNNRKEIKQTIFRPNVIDALTPQHNFEFIIVTTTSDHTNEVLPILKQFAGKAHILFFQNIWNIDEISKYLDPDQYFLGFPFMAGGGKNGNGIDSIISGSKYSKTMLGEVNGEITSRIQKMAEAMQNAGMQPFISNQIITWLVPHYVFIAGISGGIIKAGGTMEKFLINKPAIKTAIKSIREGFHICAKRGIDPRKEKVNKLYYLPLFICIPIIKKIFRNEDMASMFNKYLKNSPMEVKSMIENILEDGEKDESKTSYFKSLLEE